MVLESAANAHRHLTNSYEHWRKSLAAELTELCFEFVVVDDIPLRKAIEEVEGLLGADLEPE